MSAVIYQFDNQAIAQIVPDRTLPNNTVVSPNENISEITEGTTVGDNLFHSFSQFSVPTGDTAWFDSATNIENIIGRVTGESISDIDGLIRANGEANLFLINPNGIIFGENAALDLGGSFISSTADSIQFANGEFSAVNPEAPPLLTVNMPVGLQYGSEAGDITVEGDGHNAFFDFDTFTIDRFERNRGLEVAPGNTLGLIGKNVLLDGGNLTVEAGNLELGSVAEAGRVGITSNELGFTFDYGELVGGQIDLSNLASTDVSGNGSGNIQIYGDRVNLTSGSAIFAETEGDAAGGLVSINANELNIIGTDPDLFLPSSIWSNVYFGATGNGGSVSIATKDLLLEGGGQINVNTLDLGNAGNLTVVADEVEVIGESEGGDFVSGLFAQADIFQTGRGGNILLETNSLLVSDGGQINTNTFGEGDAGNLTIEANNIELTGASDFGNSGLFTASEGEGKGGNLTIQTDSLSIDNGAQIANTAFADGDAGTLSVTAKQIELNGASEFGPSGLFANAEGSNGGNLTVQTDSLIASNGAQIANTTFADGDAGTLSVTAKQIELTGNSEISTSGLYVSSQGEGDGGNLTIQTDSLFVEDNAGIVNDAFANGDAGTLDITAKDVLVGNGAQITSSTESSGNAGTLNIAAENIELTGESEFGASGIFSSALEGTGSGGDINLDTDKLSIQDGATISASNFFSRGDGEPGQGKAGDINIKANSVEVDNQISDFASSITASTNDGGGGNINLDLAGDIDLNNNSEISADTRGAGEGGNIDLTANNFSINNQARVSVDSTGSANAGNINLDVSQLEANRGKITATSINSGGGDISLTTDFIDLQNNSEVSTSVFDGTGGGGNINIASNYLLGRNSDIRANAVAGDGGNISITSDVVLLDFDSEIDASSEFGLDGAIDINTLETDKQIAVEAIPAKIVDPTTLITSVCPVKNGESLATTGKGGLAENPTQSIRGESVWEDLRDADIFGDKSAIIEAKAWNVNPHGKVELLGYIPQEQLSKTFNECR